MPAPSNLSDTITALRCALAWAQIREHSRDQPDDPFFRGKAFGFVEAYAIGRGLDTQTAQIELDEMLQAIATAAHVQPRP